MKIVAVEEHFLSAAVRAAWAQAAGAVRDEGQSLHRGEIEARLDEVGEARIRRMDENGVDVQVLSLTSPGLHNLGPAESVRLAQATNDRIAVAIAQYPGRFDGFATVPVAAPAAAAEELRRCVRTLGLKGGMLFGRVQDRPLDHPDFLPIFETAAELRAPLFLHPQTPADSVRQAYYAGFDPAVELAFATFGLGWHYDCGVQFLRLALAGVFDRFPELQIVLGHWGEVVLFYAERLKALERVTRLERPVVDVMRENLYVTASGMFSPAYFRNAVEVVGMDRVLFSTDDPYQYRPGRGPRNFLEELPVSEDDKRKLAHGNWERLTGAIRR